MTSMRSCVVFMAETYDLGQVMCFDTSSVVFFGVSLAILSIVTRHMFWDFPISPNICFEVVGNLWKCVFWKVKKQWTKTYVSVISGSAKTYDLASKIIENI